ncbi:hypothetical protein C7974DRAFT_338315 [Boeremia exigua]|uniref:uncharacterized protein n=1 Tax=Boeremia exigua TaxID=749465 RepID=UPI001E8D893D|nr:uncharacterized protein C7974DRAFT_338315 [Boeremia exigua]KAH6625926.1 hypothetical protein C7974DRAFT_338315 [Boeremia exigua]
MHSISCFTPGQGAVILLVVYVILVRYLRYRRAEKIAIPFATSQRSLSSMTTQEASTIMDQLQALEFPYAMNKARSVALLKAGGIPSMSRLFAVTGQNTVKNAGKRTVDTEILLRESQTQPRDSERYMRAVARMNYLHARYRRAGKILDADLLHTLGDGAGEILRVIEHEEWRALSEVEKCAVGVFHYALGRDLEIPFTLLQSRETGWRDGACFLDELIAWTKEYERDVAKPAETGDLYVRVYVDSAAKKLGSGVTALLRQVVASDLDDTMRKSLGLEKPGFLLKWILFGVRMIRKLALRYLALPRPKALAHQSVATATNSAGLYNFSHGGFQPWYVLPDLTATWHPRAVIMRLLGARKPGSNGDRYKPMGYDLRTIGPTPQEGRGLEEMAATIDAIKGRHLETCFPTMQKSE